MTEIDDIDLAKRLRENLLDVIELWASEDKQLQYQENAPMSHVSAELFCQWTDDFYHPESTHFIIAFNEKERKILADFDKILNRISDQTQDDLPCITDFVKTNEWLVINQAAVEALRKLKDGYQPQ